ncbi:hypothetical protein CPI84_08295 [Erwinia pyrifoliae]|nr:hypothetical protein CPI84_08295 [Erwinia pyrifoliae]
MRSLKTMIFAAALLSVAGCTLKESASQQISQPPPAAWAMMPPSNSLQLLDKTFSISEKELPATRQK